MSIVFAQPEQGARLASAVDKLPAVALHDDAASYISEVSRKRERLNSNASSFMSQVDARPEQPAREDDGMMRKRSRLNMAVPARPPADPDASAVADSHAETLGEYITSHAYMRGMLHVGYRLVEACSCSTRAGRRYASSTLFVLMISRHTPPYGME